MLNKFDPNEKEIAAFKAVVKAFKAARKLGLCFYGKQDALVAYTKTADEYCNSTNYGNNSSSGEGREVPHLSSINCITDSGADDYTYFKKNEDDPEWVNNK